MHSRAPLRRQQGCISADYCLGLLCFTLTGVIKAAVHVMTHIYTALWNHPKSLNQTTNMRICAL